MSVDPDGSGGTDYSDFETQMLSVEQIVEPDAGIDNSSRTTVKYTVEPLEGQGGLANNEVAELVYMETFASVEHDDEVDDQNVATESEIRGVVGANLPATEEAFPARFPVLGNAEVIGTEAVQNTDGTQAIHTVSDDAYFQMFRGAGGIPFDDETNGLGGSSSSEQFYAEKNWRGLTGRGPVMDQNDDLTILGRVIVGDTIVPVTGNIRVHCIWDVAETSDAGRRFSVPM